MQKGKWIWLVIALVVLWGNTSLKASGSLVEQSVILRTGNLQLTQPQPITLENQLVYFKLEGDYINLFVRYKFQNSTGSRKVTLAFPVDYLKFEKQPQSELLEGLKIKDEYNTEYAFTEIFDTETLTIETNREEYVAYRKWYSIEVPFPSKGERHLTVSYKVKAFVDDRESYFSFFPDFSERSINFDMAVGKLGSAKVKKFQLFVDVREHSSLDLKSLRVNLPNCSFFDGILTFSAENFNLLEVPELKLRYSNRASKTTQFVTKTRAPKECISIISTSSQYTENYPASNMLDGNLSTAWIEGVEDAGVGQWIEVELTNFRLHSIAIMNGYTKSSSTYTVNSKIKKIKVEVEYVNPFNMLDQPMKAEYIIELPKRNYDELNKQIFSTFMDVLTDFGDNYHIAKKIRLTILEVEPGTKYSDTGISELYLLGKKI